MHIDGVSMRVSPQGKRNCAILGLLLAITLFGIVQLKAVANEQIQKRTRILTLVDEIVHFLATEDAKLNDLFQQYIVTGNPQLKAEYYIQRHNFEKHILWSMMDLDSLEESESTVTKGSWLLEGYLSLIPSLSSADLKLDIANALVILNKAIAMQVQVIELFDSGKHQLAHNIIHDGYFPLLRQHFASYINVLEKSKYQKNLKSKVDHQNFDTRLNLLAKFLSILYLSFVVKVMFFHSRASSVIGVM